MNFLLVYSYSYSPRLFLFYDRIRCVLRTIDPREILVSSLLDTLIFFSGRKRNRKIEAMHNCYFWFQVTVNDRLALRGPLLLPFLAGFTALSELDLSLDKSTIGGSSGSLLFIDDKILQQFFACFSSHFKNLQSLRINFWRITLEDSEKTMRQIAKYLKLCNLSFLKANGLIVTDSAKKVQMEHVFVQTILTHLQYLTWLCLDGVDLTESQASSIGKCVRDRFPGTSLEISAKDVHVKSVKALVAAIEEGGRAEVVYTGGSNCRLKITKVQKSSKGKKKWRFGWRILGCQRQLESS